jgi:outer membrane protein OmpA-like peptidoglycan-associated protein
MSKKLFAASMIALSVAVAPACATKGFVREEVGTVNTKVDTLGTTVEQTQQRVGQNETRIGAVDQKAEAAGKAAADARSAATVAQGAADKAAAQATAVGGRVDAVATEVAAARRLIYTVTLSEDQGNFNFGGAELPDTARTRVDQMIDQLKTSSQNVYIEIEGHTDNVGDTALNERLGLARAEAVKRYLYEQHQVPLHRINVISYGEAKPVAPNNTRDGRAQNRRVVVKVLS